jgi:hypothetical protein
MSETSDSKYYLIWYIMLAKVSIQTDI